MIEVLLSTYICSPHEVTRVSVTDLNEVFLWVAADRVVVLYCGCEHTSFKLSVP